MEQQNSRRTFLKTTATGLASAAVIGGSITSIASPMRIFKPNMPSLFTEFKAIDFEKVKPALLKWPSEKAVKEHLKLYKGYVNKANEITGKLKTADKDSKNANQVFSEIRELKVEYSFAIGGVKNHEIYFDALGGEGGKPSGPFADLIARDFGSVDEWMKDVKATAIASRGWSWLAYDHDAKSLFNYLGDAQNTFPVWNASPIIALDVYEHAYWMDFGANRAQYIDEWFGHLDWKAIGARFRAIKM